LSWKRQQLGGFCQALSRHSLFLAGVVRSVLVDYREGLTIRMAAEWRATNYVVLRRWHVLGSHENIVRHSDGQPLFRDGCCHFEQDPKRALEGGFCSMFLKRKKLQRFGPQGWVFP